MAALVSSRLGRAITPRARARLQARTAGNPSSPASSSATSTISARCARSDSLEAAPVPDAVTGLVEERLTRLDPATERLLCAVAAIGPSAPVSLAARSVGLGGGRGRARGRGGALAAARQRRRRGGADDRLPACPGPRGARSRAPATPPGSGCTWRSPRLWRRTPAQSRRSWPATTGSRWIWPGPSGRSPPTAQPRGPRRRRTTTSRPPRSFAARSPCSLPTTPPRGPRRCWSWANRSS